jgi:hypothetical protein
LDSRSTSCERDDFLAKVVSRKDRKLHFNFPKSVQKLRHQPRASQDMIHFETVFEEMEEAESNPEDFAPKRRINFIEDNEDSILESGRKRRPFTYVTRSRSSDINSLNSVTETKEEYLAELQQKIRFTANLKTIIDRSESRPQGGEGYNPKKQNNGVADCLTIEEEDAENNYLDKIELSSNDGDSSKQSSSLSKSRSMKHFVVDECSADEEKKRRKFEPKDVRCGVTDQIEAIEEKDSEEEDKVEHGSKQKKNDARRMKTRDNLVKIIK